jgi:hypothetical protein
MKHQLFKNPLLKLCLLIVFCITAFASTAKAGLDYYEIYIGKKLILKRAVNQPLNLAALPISQANINDQLIIHYYQCNAPDKLGSKRVITLKDANGNKVKEWKFADGSSTGMAIPVKELVQLQKTDKDNMLDLFYSAEGRPGGEKLASIAAGTKTVGYIHRQQDLPTIKM